MKNIIIILKINFLLMRRPKIISKYTKYTMITKTLNTSINLIRKTNNFFQNYNKKFI